jgi:uncharacterized protein (TIGR00255 family)
MTGFARVRRAAGEGEVVVSVKTLNHRGLDIHLHAPSIADSLENAIRARVKQSLARGHVDVRISMTDAAKGRRGASVDHALLEAYLTAFREAAARYALKDQPDLNAALRVPGMFGEVEEGEPDAELEATILGALADALKELNAFREREGGEIGQELRGHNSRIAAVADEIDRIRAGATAAFQARLSERLRELLKGAQIEPQRLAQEAAILADRSDVGEEVARLRIHSAQLDALLDGGGEVGKKLDFLLQEMNRESNTILSKTSGVGEVGLKITDLALEAKAAIEKIREQSLNLE